MYKAKGSKLLFGVMLVLMLALVACSKESEGDAQASDGNSDNNGEAFQNPQKDEDGMYNNEDFPSGATNPGEPIDGGELTYAIVSDSPFAGTLNLNFYSGTYDADILEWIAEDLLDFDEGLAFTNEGIASFEYDADEKSMTFTIRDDVKWSDGKSLTTEDWKFAHEVVGHPGYDGPRYDSSLQNVVGMEEYHDGIEGNKDDGYQTIEEYREKHGDTITGIEIIDDQTMKISYNNFTPSLLAGGVWSSAMPKHIFGDMPVVDMSSSDAVRKDPIGLGPYKVDSIVVGESLTLSPNEHYWRGEPNLDKVTLKVVDGSNVVQELKKGTVDIAAFPTDKYSVNDDMTNVEFLSITDLAYSYVGFKMGTWDKEEHKVVPDPDMKMSDHDLREAMWYALDNETLAMKYYNGLRWDASTLIPPSHKYYHDPEIEAPTFNPDKANDILDNAGYEWKDGEDYRTGLDGKELVINFATMDGGDTAEAVAKYYIQSWADVGLNVELLDGRLQEFEAFYDRVGETGEDDPKIDIFHAGWGLGFDVDPSGLYGPNAIFNYPRYQSDENDRLLEEGLSVDSFDLDHRIDVYKEWQQLMVDDIPAFPTTYRSEFEAVNRRVVNYDISYGSDTLLYELGVTEEEPITE